MKRLLLLFLLSCAPSTPARSAHEEEVDFGQCLKKDWYPGVTNPRMDRVNVIVQYADQSGNFQPRDICLSIDGRPLLSTVDRATVIPRLAKKESITWRGTVSPGPHELAAHLRALGDGKDAFAHDHHAFDAKEGLIIEVTATSPSGELTLTTKPR